MAIALPIKPFSHFLREGSLSEIFITQLTVASLYIQSTKWESEEKVATLKVEKNRSPHSCQQWRRIPQRQKHSKFYPYGVPPLSSTHRIISIQTVERSITEDLVTLVEVFEYVDHQSGQSFASDASQFHLLQLLKLDVGFHQVLCISDIQRQMLYWYKSGKFCSWSVQTDRMNSWKVPDNIRI